MAMEYYSSRKKYCPRGPADRMGYIICKATTFFKIPRGYINFELMRATLIRFFAELMLSDTRSFD